jgi:hypothetical protein
MEQFLSISGGFSRKGGLANKYVPWCNAQIPPFTAFPGVPDVENNSSQSVNQAPISLQFPAATLQVPQLSRHSSVFELPEGMLSEERQAWGNHLPESEQLGVRHN